MSSSKSTLRRFVAEESGATMVSMQPFLRGLPGGCIITVKTLGTTVNTGFVSAQLL